MQIAGGLYAIFQSGGLAAYPGAVATARGFDELIARIRQYHSENPEQSAKIQSLTFQFFRLYSPDDDTAGWSVFFLDLGVDTLTGAAALRQAQNAAKTTANATKQAVTSRGGAVTQEVLIKRSQLSMIQN